MLFGSKDVQNNVISYFCQIAETCHIHTPISRNVNAWRKNIHLHLEAGVITWRKCNDLYFLFTTIKYIVCTTYAYFRDFSWSNSTKMAKIPWPVSMATRFKSHKSDTGFWLFALKDTSCANFIKIGDYPFPPILVILRSLQRSHFKYEMIYTKEEIHYVLYVNDLSFLIHFCLYCLHHNLFAYIVFWYWLKQSREITYTNWCTWLMYNPIVATFLIWCHKNGLLSC